jgi:hypothetical protein
MIILNNMHGQLVFKVAVAKHIVMKDLSDYIA